MKNKNTVAMLLLVMFALSSIAIIQIKPVYAAGTVTLPDAEMMLSGFSLHNWGGSPSMTKTNVAGPGVQFDLTGLGKAGIEDEYELDALAGGTGEHNADFTAYSYYSMLFINVGSSSISVKVFMNTGFTGGGGNLDAFWCSSGITLGPGESGIVTLNFSYAEGYNLEDDPVYATPPYYNGGHYAIYRLNEVTSIGFEVTSSGSAASLIASGTLTHLYINPPETNKTPPDSFFDVFVTLSSFTNLAGYDIKLTWDSTLITKSDVDYTTYSNALWGAGHWNKVFESSNAGDYELAVAALAVSASNAGASVLFKVTFHIERSCNFLLSTAIRFAVTKLSDNATPIPNPIPATITDGLFTMGSTKPDITFKVLKKIPKGSGIYQPITPPYNLEYCDWFEVEVYVSHIHDCSPLQDYDITIYFDSGLAVFKDVDAWGIFGTGSYTNITGAVHVWGVGGPWVGEEGLLFTLTFHVEFDATPAHIWKYGNANHMTFDIWLFDVTLSFGALGTILMSGIDTPLPLTFDVYFIRGDVDCSGTVTTADIGSVGYYYGDLATVKPEYDLTNDGIIDIYDIVTIATNYGYGIL